MSQTDIHAQRILVLDFGAQYTQLIARRVREAGVYCEIYPWDIDPSRIADFAPNGVILSGGPESVTDDAPPTVAEPVLELGVPVLGICYGMQALAQALGGVVQASTHREFGYAQVRRIGSSRLLDGLQDQRDADGRPLLDVWMSHGDRVETLPPGFAAIAATDSAPLAAMADEQRRL
jgi:GMP synthase (glutamine-hydrolysing)